MWVWVCLSDLQAHNESGGEAVWRAKVSIHHGVPYFFTGEDEHTSRVILQRKMVRYVFRKVAYNVKFFVCIIKLVLYLRSYQLVKAFSLLDMFT